ncbi:hypothetical protein ACWGMA_23915 [Streptomyces asiaticus]
MNDRGQVRITALPGRHAPGRWQRLLPPVMGMGAAQALQGAGLVKARSPRSWRRAGIRTSRPRWSTAPVASASP